MTIGAQLYTLRAFTQTPEDIAKTFARVASMGFRQVQCSAMGPIAPELLRDLLVRNGLTCVVTHVNQDRLLHETEAVIAEHRVFGCGMIGMGSMPDRYRGSREGLEQFIADYRPVARRITDAGLIFNYHNHDFEFQREGSQTLLDILLERIPEARLLMCTYWVQAGGGDPAQWIGKYKDRIRAIHLKDMAFGVTPQGGRGRIDVPVMEGNMNFAAILEACRQAPGIQHLLIEEDDADDAYVSLETSFANLRAAGWQA